MSVESPKTPYAVTIRYVVMSILNRLNDYSLNNYKRLTQIAIEGFTEDMSMYHIDAGIEVVYLHMSLAKTVPLPSDFVSHIRIGVPINGKLRVLTENSKILFPRTFYGSVIGGQFVADTGEAVGNTDSGDIEETGGVILFSDHYRNGQFIGGLYGLPGGVDDAYYRIDKELRQIIFSGSVPRSEIVLEYVSSGLKTDGTSLIPRECVAPLRNYVMWQMMSGELTGAISKGQVQARTSVHEVARLKQEYDESIAALRSFENSFTADEYRKMVLSTSGQHPKR